MLRIESVHKSYSNILFTGVSFTLGSSEKVGCVGLNGCGKTTLFRIIAGLEQPDSGHVILQDETIAYLPQEFTLPDTSVGAFLKSLVDDPQHDMHIVNKKLGMLDILDIPLNSPMHVLSEGQKMKLYLVKILQEGERSSKKMPILLMDEPTNHLDILGILWLEQFIRTYPNSCMIISHDRTLLNSIATKIFEIDEQKLNSYEGGYDDYLEQKEQVLQQRERDYTLQERRRKKLDDLIELSRKKGTGVQAAKNRLKHEVLSKEIYQYRDASMKNFALAGSIHKNKKMLDIKDLSFSYTTGKPIIQHANLTIFGKEKVWLFGPNGSGKTTFIRLLIGQLTPNAGTITWGANSTVAYFSQTQSHLDMEATVAEYFMKETGVTYERSFSVLSKYLFDPSFRNHRIKHLSPGQRARLSFAVFAQKDYDFLVLDEPTNHLDIRTKELIEQALHEFEGNILLISHDRYFVDEVEPDRAITIEEGEVREVNVS